MGFNNEGHDARAPAPGTAIGAVSSASISAPTRIQHDRIADYVAGYRRFAELADYVTVNISSPNTPGLRNLQGKDELDALLARLERSARAIDKAAADCLSRSRRILSDSELEQVAEACLAGEVDGVIISNTTISRPRLRYRSHAGETGGLSGRPLFALATRQLARFYLLTGGDAADRCRRALKMPKPPGQKFAPVHPCCSSIRRWSSKGRPLIEEILAGLSCETRERRLWRSRGSGRLRSRGARGPRIKRHIAPEKRRESSVGLQRVERPIDGFEKIVFALAADEEAQGLAEIGGIDEGAIDKLAAASAMLRPSSSRRA